MIQEFVWNRVRYLNRVPGMYSLFYACANVYLRDGKVVNLRKGPAAGYRWCHYRGYQPWMALGLYEPSVATKIQQLLKPGDVFYDIGANAGYFSLLAAKAVGGSGKVVAFEPMAKSCDIIRKQLVINALTDRCWVEEIAISESNAMAQFAILDRSANAHLADVDAPHVNGQRQTNTVDVTCQSLDSYVAEHPTLRPNLIKIDIEGAEVKALKGAKKLLESPNPPSFLVTAHSTSLATEVQAIFTNAGYQIGNFPDMIHAIPRSA